MKTLIVNLKCLYKSIWLIIALITMIALSVFLFVNTNGVPIYFTAESAHINIFLTVLVPMVSVSLFLKTSDLERSVESYSNIVLSQYAAITIFVMSAMIVPIGFLLYLAASVSLAAIVLMNYIGYFLLSTLAEVMFLVPLSLISATVIKTKGAYIVSIIVSLMFTPFLTNIFYNDRFDIFTRAEINTFSYALFNLINIAFDDPRRLRLAGGGMSFSGETVLSWIITALAGVLIIAVFIAVNGFAEKKTPVKAIIASCIAAALLVPTTTGYFKNSSYGYNYTPMDAIAEKVNEYAGDGSAVQVTDYDIEAKLGNRLRCKVKMTVSNPENEKLRFTFDEKFEIKEITADGKKCEYNRNGDNISLEYSSVSGKSEIGFEYEARLNYTDAMHHKINYSDINSAYLPELFAWYPKILSKSNDIEKNFTLSISPNNTFVTNLNGNELMKREKAVITGRKKDIYIFSGYIGETALEGKKVIMPLEYINNHKAIENAKRYMKNIISHETTEYPLFIPMPQTCETPEEFEAAMEKIRKESLIPSEKIDAIDTFLFLPAGYGNLFSHYMYETNYIACEFLIGEY